MFHDGYLATWKTCLASLSTETAGDRTVDGDDSKTPCAVSSQCVLVMSFLAFIETHFEGFQSRPLIILIIAKHWQSLSWSSFLWNRGDWGREGYR